MQMNLLSPAPRAERQHRCSQRGAWIGRAAALFAASLLGASLAAPGAQAQGLADYDLLLQGAWWADRSFADDLLAGDCAQVRSDEAGRCAFLRIGGRVFNRSEDSQQGRGEVEEDAAGFAAGFRLPREEGHTVSLGMAYETSDGELALNGEATGQRLLFGAASTSQTGNWNLGYALNVGYARHEMRRGVAMGSTPQSDPRVVLAGGHVRFGNRYGLPSDFAGLKSLELRPSLHSSVLYAKAQRMSESGGQNLQINDLEELYLVLRPSVELRGAAPDLGGLSVQPYLQLGFAWFAVGSETDFIGRDASGPVSGTGKFDSILAEGALGVRLSGEQAALGLGYEGSFGGDSTSHRAMLRLELAF